MSALLNDDPSELTQSCPGVSPGLDRIVRRCLEKEPADRFQSVRDLGFALQAVTGSDISPASRRLLPHLFGARNSPRLACLLLPSC